MATGPNPSDPSISGEFFVTGNQKRCCCTEWQHIVTSVASQKIRLYVNGLLVSEEDAFHDGSGCLLQLTSDDLRFEIQEVFSSDTVPG